MDCLDFDTNLNCHICSYSHFHNSNISPGSPIFDPVICQQKKNVSVVKEIYVASHCSKNCEGTEIDPFDNLHTAFSYIVEKFNSYNFSSITIYLMGGLKHYLFTNSNEEKQVYLMRRLNINLTITPLYCSYKKTNDCLSSEERPEIFLKTNSIYFFISNQLNLINITINGIDIVLNENNVALNYFLNETICSENDLLILNNSNNIDCYYKNSSYLDNKNIYGLFNLEPFFDCDFCSPAKIIFTNVDFKFINSLQSWSSLIKILKGYPIEVKITKTNFSKIYFPQGIIGIMTIPDPFYFLSFNSILELTNKIQNKNITLTFEGNNFAFYNFLNLSEYENLKIFDLNNSFNKVYTRVLAILNLQIINDNYSSYFSWKNSWKFIFINDFSNRSTFKIYAINLQNSHFNLFLHIKTLMSFISLENSLFINNINSGFSFEDKNMVLFRNNTVSYNTLNEMHLFYLSNIKIFVINCLLKNIFTLNEKLSSVFGINTKLIYDISAIFYEKGSKNYSFDELFLENSTFEYFYFTNLLSTITTLRNIFIKNCSFYSLFLMHEQSLIQCYVESEINLNNINFKNIIGYYILYINYSRKRLFHKVFYVNSTASFSYLGQMSKAPSFHYMKLYISCIHMENITIFINDINPSNFFMSLVPRYTSDNTDLIFKDSIIRNITFSKASKNNYLVNYYGLYFSYIFNLTFREIGNCFIFYAENSYTFEYNSVANISNLTISNSHYAYNSFFILNYISFILLENSSFFGGSKIINFSALVFVCFPKCYLVLINNIISDFKPAFSSTLYLKYQNFKRVLISDCIFKNNGDISFPYADIMTSFIEKLDYLKNFKSNFELMFENYFHYCRDFTNLTSTNKSQCLKTLNNIEENFLKIDENFPFFNVIEWNILLLDYGIQSCLFISGKGISIFLAGNNDCLIKNSFFSNYESNLAIIYVKESNLYIYEVKIENCLSFGSGGVFYLLSLSFSFLWNLTILNTKAYGFGGGFYLFGSILEIENLIVEKTSAEKGGLMDSTSAIVNISNSCIINAFAEFLGGTFFMGFSELSLSNILIKNSSSFFDGGGIYLENNKMFTLKNATVENSTSLRNGIIFITGSEDNFYSFENLKCISNYGKLASCIMVKEGKVVITSALIYNSSADNYLIYAYSSFSKIFLWVQNTSFHLNCVRKSLISYERSDLSHNNVLFKDNQFYGNGIIVSFSNLSFENSTITYTQFFQINPTNTSYFSFFLIFSSVGKLTKINFNFDFVNLGGVSIENSILDIFSNTFLSCIKTKGGALFINSFSSILIENNLFYGNSGDYGGAICVLNSWILIENNKFIQNYGINQGSDVYISNFLYKSKTQIKILSNLFTRFYLISCSFTQIFSLEIQNSSFEQDLYDPLNILKIQIYELSKNNSTQAIYLENVLTTFINCTKISNMNYLSGLQAINLDYYAMELTIFYSFLINCTTKLSGGGLSLFGGFNITLINNIFQNNVAIFDGGAIFSDCFSSSCLNYSLEKNTFGNNFAQHYGGAFKFPFISLNQLEKNTYDNNIAFIGNISCANVAKIYVSVYNLSEENFNKPMNMAISVEIMNISSGQSFKLYALLLDNLNNFLIYEESGEISIEIKINYEDYDISAKKKYMNLKLLNSKIEVKSGVGYFPSLTIIGEPGEIYKGIISYKKSNIFVESKLYFNILFCQIGEVYVNSKCIPCPTGFYSLENDSYKNGKDFCEVCVEHAKCHGLNHIIPEQGYWRFNEQSILMIQCFNTENCPDQTSEFLKNKANYSYYCKPGSYGNLCSNCFSGYGKDSSEVCLKCSSNPLLYLKFFIFLFISFSFLIYQSWITIKDEDDALKRSLLKLLINHNFYLSFLDNLKLNWFGNIKDFIAYSDSYATSVPKGILNFECFISDYVNMELVPVFKLILFSFFPILIFLSLLVIRIIIITFQKFIDCLLKKGNNFKMRIIIKEVPQLIGVSFIVTVYNFYSRITMSTLQMLKCINLDQTSRTFLEIDPNIECWASGGMHYYLLRTLFLVNFCFWCLGWPIFLFCILKLRNYKYVKSLMKNISIGKEYHKSIKEKKKVQLNFDTQIIRKPFDEFAIIFPKTQKFKNVNKTISVTQKIKKKQSVKYPLQHEKILLDDHHSDQMFQRNKIFKFLTYDYRGNFYYWEIFFYLSNLIIGILSIATKQMDPNSQGGIFIVIYFIMLLVTETCKPFRFVIANQIASFSYLTLIFTIGFILMTLLEKQNYGFQSTLYFALIIFINALFYLRWIIAFGKQIIIRYMSCFGKVATYFNRNHQKNK